MLVVYHYSIGIFSIYFNQVVKVNLHSEIIIGIVSIKEDIVILDMDVNNNIEVLFVKVKVEKIRGVFIFKMVKNENVN